MKLFYSWQSDRPGKTGRHFIRGALEAAIEELAADLEPEDAERDLPELDHDTKGVAGSPHIAETILAKIRDSAAFIADVTPVGVSPEGKQLTNPNVAIELGYALATIGSAGLLTVLNKAHGSPEALPFDLRHRRWPITYDLPDGADNAAIKAGRKDLVGQLKVAVGALIAARPVPAADASGGRVGEIERMIADGSSGAPALVVDFTNDLSRTLLRQAPDLPLSEDADEYFISALEAATPLCIEFARLSRAAAMSGRLDVIDAVYEGFIHMHHLTDGSLGGRASSYSSMNSDFGQFIVYESFLTFVAHLLHSDRLEAIANILNRPLIREDGRELTWNCFCRYIKILDDMRRRRLKINRMSVVHDVMMQRHAENGALNPFASYEAVADADFFLMLRAAVPYNSGLDALRTGRDYWVPFAMLGTERIPEFLRRSTRKTTAARLASAMNIKSVDELKRKLREFRTLNQKIFTDGFVRSPGDFNLEFFDLIGSYP